MSLLHPAPDRTELGGARINDPRSTLRLERGHQRVEIVLEHPEIGAGRPFAGQRIRIQSPADLGAGFVGDLSDQPRIADVLHEHRSHPFIAYLPDQGRDFRRRGLVMGGQSLRRDELQLPGLPQVAEGVMAVTTLRWLAGKPAIWASAFFSSACRRVR